MEVSSTSKPKKRKDKSHFSRKLDKIDKQKINKLFEKIDKEISTINPDSISDSSNDKSRYNMYVKKISEDVIATIRDVAKSKSAKSELSEFILPESDSSKTEKPLTETDSDFSDLELPTSEFSGFDYIETNTDEGRDFDSVEPISPKSKKITDYIADLEKSRILEKISTSNIPNKSDTPDKSSEPSTDFIKEFMERKAEIRKSFPHKFIPYDPSQLKKYVPGDLKSIDEQFPALFEPISEINCNYINRNKGIISNIIKRYKIANLSLKYILFQFENDFHKSLTNNIKIFWNRFIRTFHHYYTFHKLDFGKFNYDLDKFNHTLHPPAAEYLDNFIKILNTLLLMENMFDYHQNTIVYALESQLGSCYTFLLLDSELMKSINANLGKFLEIAVINLLIKLKIDSLILFHFIDYIFDKNGITECLKTDKDTKKITTHKLFKPKNIDGTFIINYLNNRFKAISNSSPLLKNKYKENYIEKLPDKFKSLTSLKDFTGLTSQYLNSLFSFITEFSYAELYCLCQVRVNPTYDHKNVIKIRTGISENLRHYSEIMRCIPFKKFRVCAMVLIYQDEPIPLSTKETMDKMKNWKKTLETFDKIDKELTNITFDLLNEMHKTKLNLPLIEKKTNRYRELENSLRKCLGKFYNLPKPPIFIHDTLKSIFLLENI